MIDWIAAVIPCTHIEPIHGGSYQRLDQRDRVTWSLPLRRPMSGSYSSAMTIRTAAWMGDCTHIEVSGNPAKFLQGHNLWGSDDVVGLMLGFLHWLAAEHGLGESPLVSPTEADIRAWKSGDYLVTRIDIADSYRLGSRADVLAWLRAAEASARMRYCGRGMLKGDTLYFGRNSRRRTLKLYGKAQEIEAHPRHQPALQNQPEAREWAQNILRTELTLRSPELQRIGLQRAADWGRERLSSGARGLLQDRLGSLTMTSNRSLPQSVLDDLTPSQRTAYLAWRAGNDLRGIMPNSSFYRLRRILLAHRIDLAIPPPKDQLAANVVPLIRVIEAVPEPAPDWAMGTRMYFEPRRIA